MGGEGERRTPLVLPLPAASLQPGSGGTPSLPAAGAMGAGEARRREAGGEVCFKKGRVAGGAPV